MGRLLTLTRQRGERVLLRGETTLTSFEEGETVTITGDGDFDATPSPYGGSRSYKITTTANTIASVTIDLGEAIDLTGKNVAVCIRADGPRSLWNLLSLDASATSGFTAFKYRNHVYPPFAEPEATNTDWAWLPHPSGAWQDSGSSPSLTNVQYLRLRVRSPSANDIWFDQVVIYDNPLHGTNGIVSFRWDDGYESQRDNIPLIFGPRNVSCGVYLAEDWLDQSTGTGFMTASDAQAMLAAGYEMGVHGITSHTDLLGDEDAIRAEVKRNQAIVTSIGGRGDVYIYPKGHVEGTTSVTVLEGLKFKLANPVYSLGNEVDTVPPMEPMLTRSSSLTESTATAGKIATWVSQCQQGAWLILMGHQIDTDLAGLGISSTKVEDVLDAMLAGGVTVLPIGEVIDTYFSYGHG